MRTCEAWYNHRGRFLFHGCIAAKIVVVIVVVVHQHLHVHVRVFKSSPRAQPHCPRRAAGRQVKHPSNHPSILDSSLLHTTAAVQSSTRALPSTLLGTRIRAVPSRPCTCMLGVWKKDPVSNTYKYLVERSERERTGLLGRNRLIINTYAKPSITQTLVELTVTPVV